MDSGYVRISHLNVMWESHTWMSCENLTPECHVRISHLNVMSESYTWMSPEFWILVQLGFGLSNTKICSRQEYAHPTGLLPRTVLDEESVKNKNRTPYLQLTRKKRHLKDILSRQTYWKTLESKGDPGMVQNK